MPADGMAKQRARASATMILSIINQSNYLYGWFKLAAVCVVCNNMTFLRLMHGMSDYIVYIYKKCGGQITMVKYTNIVWYFPHATYS